MVHHQMHGVHLEQKDGIKIKILIWNKKVGNILLFYLFIYQLVLKKIDYYSIMQTIICIYEKRL